MIGNNPRLIGRLEVIGLVREFMLRSEDNDRYRTRKAPILLLIGPHGSEKTLVLAELARQLAGNVPYALVDFSGDRDLPAAEVLTALVFELNRKCEAYDKLGFPRFLVGRLVQAQALDSNDREKARAQVRQTLEENRKIDKLHDFLQDAVPRVLGSVPQTGLSPAAAEMAGRYAPDLVLRGLRLWGVGRRLVLGEGQDWYGHQDRGLNHDPTDVLIDLNRKARRPRDRHDQQAADDLLWAAFLADLRASFERRKKTDRWSFNCVVLLDHVNTGAGRRFLDGLVAARGARAGGDPDPLTVVAASRALLPGAALLEPVPVPLASYDDYAGRDRQRHDLWWYPVSLPDLSEADIAGAVSALDLPDRIRGQVTSVAFELTGGHPAATRLVLDAVAGRPELQVDELYRIQDWPVPGPAGPEGHTLAGCLRAKFLEEFPARAFEDLVTCAAARNLEEAGRLHIDGEAPVGLIHDRRVFSRQEPWSGTDGAERRTLRGGLRRLLLRELAARAADHDADWSAVYAWLRDNSRDEAGRLYHMLALGGLELVARQLSRLLPERDVHEWLALLRAVTQAPDRLAPRASPVDGLRELVSWTDPRDLPVAPTARLTAARWIMADPLACARTPDLHLVIAEAYEEISPFSPNGITVLLAEARKHRRLADSWS